MIKKVKKFRLRVLWFFLGNKIKSFKSGFTLIELSIVLVVIGLLIGGVLVGKDLFDAAAVRSQISQIEKYNLAFNTFKIKYGYLPGDIPNPTAGAFGFATRGSAPGQGDGDGILQGFYTNNNFKYGWAQAGEPLMFWVDLSTAGLIEGNFSTASPSSKPSSDVTGSGIDTYLPKAIIGNGYIYTLNNNSTDTDSWYVPNPKYRNNNFFTISQVQSIGFSSFYTQNIGKTGIAVKQAYNIDKKIDDGMPITGKITTVYSNGNSSNKEIAFSNNDFSIVNSATVPGGSAIPASTTTCYDNNNSSSNPVTYSLSQNGGNGLNCALSFQFQ